MSGKPESQTVVPWTGWVTSICVLVGAAFGFALVATHPALMSDETVHGVQIWHFYTGGRSILKRITMVPSYHAILASIAYVTGYYRDTVHRLITLLVGLGLPWLAYRLAAMYTPATAGRRTLQVFFFPLLYPFFFLIYTDVWALTAVLATQLCVMSRRYWLAGIPALVSVILRQDMVTWVALAWLLMAHREWGVSGWLSDVRPRLRRLLYQGAPLLLIMALQAAFVVWNGGVAVGDRLEHEEGIHVTNGYFLLLSAWLMFLPQNLAAVPRIMKLPHKPWIVAGVLAGYFLYMGTFNNPHIYNQSDLPRWLHNRVLGRMTDDAWIRAACYIPMVWMVLTAGVNRFAETRMRWLFPIAVLSAVLHPLIEPRYYLPAMALFQMWRPELDDRWENASLIAGILLSAGLMFGIVTDRFFL